MLPSLRKEISMKKKILALCALTAVAGSLIARDSYRTSTRATRTHQTDWMSKYRRRAKSFVGKYLAMNAEQQKMVRSQVKMFIGKHAKGAAFITKLKAKLNQMVQNPSDTPISNFVKKVHALSTKQEKVAFLKTQWRKIGRESKRRLVMKVVRFVGFAEAVKREGLSGQFKDEIASIRDRLMKLEAKGPVPAESEKVTDKLKDQEEIPADEEIAMQEGVMETAVIE